MKKIIVFALFSVVCLLSSTIIFAKDSVFVSILPQQFFVEYLAKDFLTVNVLVKPGQSPETYDPTPKQMVMLASAKLYFTLGLNFEQRILKRIIDNNQNLKVVATHQNINLVGGDPHIWLDPILVQQQVDEIYFALAQKYPNHKQILQQRFVRLQEKIKAIDKEIQQVFSLKMAVQANSKPSFVVFHPALSYFSRRYHLNQVAIEKEGKSNSAKYMADLMGELKSKSVKYILVEKQFSKKEALTIANVLNAKLLEFDPLAFSWLNNMQIIAKQVKRSLF